MCVYVCVSVGPWVFGVLPFEPVSLCVCLCACLYACFCGWVHVWANVCLCYSAYMWVVACVSMQEYHRLSASCYRFMQAQSADKESVASHYSSELVAFVRRVMEAVPLLVFENLRAIMDLQARMRVCDTLRLVNPFGCWFVLSSPSSMGSVQLPWNRDVPSSSA